MKATKHIRLEADPNYSPHNLTLENALHIQRQDLRDWELVLSPETYFDLEKRVIGSNTGPHQNPWNVCRGCNILQLLYVIIMERRKANKG